MLAVGTDPRRPPARACRRPAAASPATARRLSRARGALVPPLSAAFTASAEHGFHGLGQRMVLTVGLSWFAAAAWFLLRSTARKGPTPEAGDGNGVDGGRIAC